MAVDFDKIFGVVVGITFLIFVGTLGYMMSTDSQVSASEMKDGEERIFESLYGPVKVENDRDGFRNMYISNGIMGQINASNKFHKTEGWEYLYLMEDIIVDLKPKSVLALGVGAGIVPMRLNELHDIPVDGVDINKVVLDVAVEYFGLVPSETLKLITEDARMYLKNSDKKYDVIAMDVFKFVNRRYIVPPHLATQEYYEILKEDLVEDGALVLMLLNDKRDNDFVASEIETIKSVFNYVYIFDAHLMVLVASDKEINFSEELLNMSYTKEIVRGKIYTDDFAPIIY